MGEVERGVVVGIVERKRHADAVERYIEVRIERVGPWRAVAATHRRVVVGVLRTDGTSDNQRVALGDGRYGILRQRLAKSPSIPPPQGRGE